MERQVLEAVERRETGRNALRRARKEGKIPGIIYGESGNWPVYLDSVPLRSYLRHAVGGAAIVDLRLDGREHPSLLAECQRDPLRDTLLHVDFHEISMKKKMHAHVPVTLVGVEECIGVKAENGVLEFLSHGLEIRCLPQDLPAEYVVDVARLHVGQIVHVKDLAPLDGVEFLGSPDQVIVVCGAMKVGEGAGPAGEESADGETGTPAPKG
jgi:large subunit ribosomal protein L25